MNSTNDVPSLIIDKMQIAQNKKAEAFKLKKSIYVIMLILALGLFSGCQKADSDMEAVKETELEAAESYLTGKHHVEIEVENYGMIAVELDADLAPISVTNFVKLAKEGFYDGLTFHRIIDGFMIQGGDPAGTGSGGSEDTIKGEFASNGVENPISHMRGTISMARSMDNNGASSQFFIVQADSTYLDGDYAAFGHVTEGMEIVDQICKETPVQDGNGTVLAQDQPVMKSVKVVE